MKRMNAAVIGSGFIGPVHVEALRRLGYINVAGIADIDEQASRKAAERLHIPTAYQTWEALVEDERIDVVHICTPNHLHYEMARYALENGKNVICEKPMALTVQEGTVLSELAKKSGKVCSVNFNYRFFPLVHQMKAMIAKGELGRIVSVCGSYQQDWLLYDTDYSWRIDPRISGPTRAVMDIGSHWLDMAQFLLDDRIESVTSDMATFHPYRFKPAQTAATFGSSSDSRKERVIVRTEDYASVLLRFQGGARGSMTVTQMAAGRKNRLYIEVCGTKASVVFDSERCNELWIGRRESANGLLLRDAALLEPSAASICAYPGGHNEGFADTVKQHFNAVYNEIENPQNVCSTMYATFSDGLYEILLNEAIKRSGESGRWETVKL